MEKENLKSNFNVGNPTNENIEYAFKNLIYYLTGSCELNMYAFKKQSFEEVLKKTQSILKQYVNSGNLFTIDENTLKDIKFDLIDLDTATKELKSYYAEWSLLWLESIINLRISEINRRGINNT